MTPESNSGDFDFAAAPELLAPAGTLISLLAAVQNGADAVYMGASRFSARAYAGNFSDFELAAGIDYAHAFGKKVYVTLNTLYKDEEMDAVMLLFDELYQCGVDSVIVQDLGLLSKITEKYPDFAVHASTQMTVHNSYHASFLHQKGVSRVVPARENSIPELIEIKKTGVEVETFIHGALCICYSGQCLFSSLVGSRSGNRGKCAQPCRKRYTLLVDGKPVAADGQYLISPKDLNASEHLENLISAGVDSFKIEGRMKKPEYVAGVVSVYRHLIDRIMAKMKKSEPNEPNNDIKIGPTFAEKETLKKLFNRDFTNGYFFQNPGNALMSRQLPYNKGILIGRIAAVDNRNHKISVLLTSELSAHDGISIGDIGKNMNSTEDPRLGFTVKKMYVGRNICSKAGANDTVEIPLPAPDENRNVQKLPNTGDAVYKTFDFELQRNLLKTFPNTGDSENESDFVEKTVLSVYSNLSAPSQKSNRSSSKNSSESSSKNSSESSSEISPNNFSDSSSSLSEYSSSDVFPISEMVEKLSPAESVQIPVSFNCQIRPGFPISVFVSDSEGHNAAVHSEYIIEPAQKNPFTKEQALDIFFKLGGTIYQTVSANADISGECFVPVGEFKNARNKALQALLNERITEKKRQPVSCVLPNNSPAGSSFNAPAPGVPAVSVVSVSALPFISVSVYSVDGLYAALAAGADRIYAGGELFKDVITGAEYGITAEILAKTAAGFNDDDKEKIFFKTPFVTKENDFASLKKDFLLLKEAGIKGVLASNIGVYEFLKTESEFSGFFKIAADEAFNIFNSDAANVFANEVSSVLLSPELSLSEIELLIRTFISRNGPNSMPETLPFECFVHGRQRLMVTEHPLLQSLIHEKSVHFNDSDSASKSFISAERYLLKDTKDYAFPVLADRKGRNYIFNSKILNAFDLLPKISAAGVFVFRIDGLGYTPDEIAVLVSSYKKGLDSGGSKSGFAFSGGNSVFTKGNFIRGAE